MDGVRGRKYIKSQDSETLYLSAVEWTQKFKIPPRRRQRQRPQEENADLLDEPLVQMADNNIPLFTFPVFICCHCQQDT